MHFFVQSVCRQNNQSENFKVFCAFESSIKAFDNIFGNNFFLMNTVLLKFQNFILKPKVCKNGGNFRLQKGLNLLCRVWPSGQLPKRRMFWSQLEALYDFQNLWSVFGNGEFWENPRNSVSKMTTFFSVFQYAAPTCSHARNELVNEKHSWKWNCVFTVFATITKHYQITTLNFRQMKVHGYANILWLNAVK